VLSWFHPLMDRAGAEPLDASRAPRSVRRAAGGGRRHRVHAERRFPSRCASVRAVGPQESRLHADARPDPSGVTGPHAHLTRPVALPAPEFLRRGLRRLEPGVSRDLLASGSGGKTTTQIKDQGSRRPISHPDRGRFAPQESRTRRRVPRFHFALRSLRDSRRGGPRTGAPPSDGGCGSGGQIEANAAAMTFAALAADDAGDVGSGKTFPSPCDAGFPCSPGCCSGAAS
jgi:hypothetical protein